MNQIEPSRSIQPAQCLLLRLPAVEEITGVKKSTLYAMMKAAPPHQFPAPVRLSARAVAWRSDDVAAWVESRVKVNAQPVQP